MSMSVSQAIAYINRHCGYRTGGETNILLELNSAKQSLEDDERLSEVWFLQKENTSLVTVANTRTVAIPSDFVKESEDAGGLFRYEATDTNDPYKELIKQDLAWLRRTKTGTDKPAFYAIWGNDFHLFPLPDDAYPLRLFYKYAASDYAVGEVARDWLLHTPLLLAGRAGFSYAQGLRDEIAMQYFAALETDARSRLEALIAERKYSSHRLVMGGDD
jgi:hypothetical protein